MNTPVALPPTMAAWLLQSDLAEFVPLYWHYLVESRYAATTRRTYLCCIAHFAHWLTQQQRAVCDLGDDFRRFLDQHLPQCACPPPVRRSRSDVRAALRHLRAVLYERHGAPRHQAASAIDEELRRFDAYMDQHRGLALNTRTQRLHLLRSFLLQTSGSAGARGTFGSPHWSADGRRMVFHRDVDHEWPPLREWYSPDARFRLVRTGVFPSFAPSGDRFVSNDKTAGVLHNNFLVMNADGSLRSTLFQETEKSALAPVWSPRGNRIAFALGRFFQSVHGPANADIAVINSDGTGLKLLTDGTANYGFPSWSPDGQHLVFRYSREGKSGLLLIDIETGDIKALNTNLDKANFPAWSPSGDLIAFTGHIEGDYEIFTISPTGTNLKRLTHASGNDSHCSWSPDGQWIAFTSARGGFKDEAALNPFNPQPYGDIYVMRADGSDVRRLTDNQYEEGTPSWISLR